MTNNDRHSRRDGDATSTDVSLNELSLKFHRLKQILNDALRWKKSDDIQTDWLPNQKSVEERMLNPIEDELIRLTWLAAEIEASTAVEVNLKAGILLASYDGSTARHTDALAQSLAKDVIRLL